MPFQEMKIKGAWIHTPIRHTDERGQFEEKFKLSLVETELGRSFSVVQVNQSLSNKGVIRGVHYTEGLPGQAKYVSCPKGSIWDVVVDLRPGSETFGEWDAIELSEENGLSVFISEGLGHAFLSLRNGSVASYLCSSEYSPELDKIINPLSPRLAIPFASYEISKFILSAKDSNSPMF